MKNILYKLPVSLYVATWFALICLIAYFVA